MDSTLQAENLLRDSVRKLTEVIVSGAWASLVGAAAIALVVGGILDPRQLTPWLGGIVLICIARLFLSHHFEKKERDSADIRRYRALFLAGLAVTGALWGSTAFWSFTVDQLAYQVFVTFVLGGMVAGSVGIYSVMLSAFFFFSVPTLFPMVLKFFLVGGEIHYAMGFMLLLYWIIMLFTALKLNRDIVGYLLTKYKNLDLIADLEAEMTVRKAAEDDLRKKNLEIEGIVSQRTEALLESNNKLIREIEERQIVSAALKENEEKYREMVESINDVIYSADSGGVVNYVSPVARSVLGYEPEELIGKDFRDFVHKDDLKMFMAVMDRRVAGDTRSIEYRFRTRTDEYRWVRSSSRAIFKDNTFVGVRGVLTDISEKRKLEDQLRLTQKMEAIATLSGGVAHDFNNLLAVILGNTELAMLDPKASPSVHRHLEKIVDSSLKAKDIVKELLSFARRSQLERKPVNVGAVVRGEVARLGLSLPAAVTLEREIPDDIGTILADEVQVGQVVGNILDNAVEAMADAGGTLGIRVKRVLLAVKDIDFDSDMTPGRYVQISVTDTGCGIRPENIGRLFDPYYSTKEFGKGDGLGLAVAHGIVKRHGGGVRVKSAPGKGARFEVFFPELD